MESLKLESLIEKFAKFQNFNIILIEEDLAEKFIKKPKINDELKNVVAKSLYGYCFKIDSDEYLFWNYDSSNNKFETYEKTGKDRIYLHDKISKNEDFLKF